MLTLLADNSFGDDLGDGVAGPLGLLIIVLLVVATVFLLRDMNKRLKRLPESFPAPGDVSSGAGHVPREPADTSAVDTPAVPGDVTTTP